MQIRITKNEFPRQDHLQSTCRWLPAIAFGHYQPCDAVCQAVMAPVVIAAHCWVVLIFRRLFPHWRYVLYFDGAPYGAGVGWGLGCVSVHGSEETSRMSATDLIFDPFSFFAEVLGQPQGCSQPVWQPACPPPPPHTVLSV